MNLGRMIRSGRAVDDFSTTTKDDKLVTAVDVSTSVTPVVTEKIVYVDKIVEKPVYVERVVEVEKVIEVEKPVYVEVEKVVTATDTNSTFFDDYVPSDWAKQKV